MDDNYLKKICRDIFQEAQSNIWTVRWENEYFTAIKRVMPFVKQMNPYPNYLNLKNGVLDLTTMKLGDHDPQYLSTNQILINHNPKATCPQFLTFLGDIFEGDQERMELMQEILGYCFLQDVKIQKVFIFLGNGSNGKSVLAEIMRNLIGPDNVSNVPLSAMSGDFGLQNLPGKFVNIASENEMDKKFNTQNIKMLTGGDSVNINQKNVDSFNMKLFVKIFLLLNRMMDSGDVSEGYYRRLTIMMFNKKYVELKAGEQPKPGISYMDKQLVNRLLVELEGILIFALKGLQRLFQNNFNLTNSVVCEQALEDYKGNQNPIIKFYNEMIEIDTTSTVKRSDIGKFFSQWAFDNGYKEYSNYNPRKFLEEFRNILDEKGNVIVEKKVNGHQCIGGLRIKSLSGDASDYVPSC